MYRKFSYFGTNPNKIAWEVIDYAPDIFLTACDAMIVAIVAKITKGKVKAWGTIERMDFQFLQDY
jgi:hypothetical protein